MENIDVSLATQAGQPAPPAGWDLVGSYRSHKIVKAAEISAISAKTQDGAIIGWSALVKAANGQLMTLEINDPGLCARSTPNVGDWLVQYGDGYVSHSPRGVFEAGYGYLGAAPATD